MLTLRLLNAIFFGKFARMESLFLIALPQGSDRWRFG